MGFSHKAYTCKFIVSAQLLLACALGVAASGTTGPDNQAPRSEQALRARVEEFYSLCQQGQLDRAATYVTEDTRENFRSERRGAFLSFQVESVKLDSGAQAATVSIEKRIFSAQMPMGGGLPIVETTRWRLVKGEWSVEIPKRDPKTLADLFSGSGQKGATPSTPTTEELKFKGHTYSFAKIAPGQIKVAEFPFTNATDHAVTITDVVTGCDCLTAKLEKKRYKPGESGVLAVTFNPKGYARQYGQTLVVKTDPGSQITYLKVVGYVLSAPAQPAASGSETKPPATSP